jgi:hypothetical protein
MVNCKPERCTAKGNDNISYCNINACLIWLQTETIMNKCIGIIEEADIESNCKHTKHYDKPICSFQQFNILQFNGLSLILFSLIFNSFNIANSIFLNIFNFTSSATLSMYEASKAHKKPKNSIPTDTKSGVP